MENENNKINGIKKNISKYLGQRLGKYDVKDYLFDTVKSKVIKDDFQLVQDINLKNLGLFGLSLQSCKLIANFQFKDTNKYVVTLRLDYKHKGFGQNSSDLDIILKVDGDNLKEI